jgi:FixJ family two-component response regulator
MSVKAMKAGAVEFLTKPFRDQDLLDAIQLAIEYDPRPPFDTGSPSKAPAEIVEFVRLQLSTLAVPTPPAGHEAPPGD